MRKLFAMVATLAVVLSMFSGIAFAAPGDYTVAFASGSSTQAGANSKLVFTITPNAAGEQYVEIDLGTTGFVPTGAATWEQGAPLATLASTTTIVGTKVSVTATPVVANTDYVITIPVRNPLTAQTVAAGITVKSGATVAAVNTLVGVPALAVTYTVTPSVTSGVAGAPATVNFTVTETGSIVTVPLTYTVVKNAVTVLTGSTLNGTFSATLPFDLTATASAESYTVTVTSGAPAKTGSTTIKVKYNMTVTGIDGLKAGDTTTVGGTVVDATGKAVAGLIVGVFTKADTTHTAPLGTAITTSAGTFAMGIAFAHANDYVIAVKTGTANAYSDYTSFSVSAVTGKLTISLDKTEILKLNGGVVTPTLKINDAAPAGGTTQQIRVLGPDGTVLQNWGVGATYTVAVGATVGTYTIEARHFEVGSPLASPDATASATFVVKAPSKLNVAFGSTTLNADGLMLVGAASNVTVTIVDVAGTGYTGAAATASQIKKVVFTVNGAVASEVKFDSEATGAAWDVAPLGNKAKTLTFSVVGAGVVTISGTVTFGDGSTETFTKEYTTNGWNVVTEKVLGTAGQVVLLRAVVTDAKGNFVNNAAISWTAGTQVFHTVKASNGTWGTPATAVVVDGQTVNINNGVYEKEVKLIQATGTVAFQAIRSGGAVEYAQFNTKINGESVYTVTPAVSSVIGTLANQKLRVSVADANGAVVNNLTTLNVVGSTGVGVNLSIGNATPVDTNKDGLTDAYDFNVSPAALGKLTITAGTDNNNKVGTAEVTVVAPSVTVSLGDKVTENVKEALTLTSTDLDAAGSARSFLVRFTAAGASMKLESNPAGTTHTDGTAVNQTYTTGAAAEHKLLITAWDDSNNTTVNPTVKVEVSYDNGANYVELPRLAVTPLNIDVTPDTLFVGGINKVTATVTDAHGVAYANKTVGLAGSTGTTDENGAVSLFISPNSTGTATITVNTSRTGVTTDKKVTIAVDNVKPELTITSALTSTSAKYVLKGSFSDNLKVTAIYVNGQSVPFIAETGEFEYSTTLALGDNNFTVFVFDAANNGAKQEVTIKCGAAPKTVLQGSSVARKGDNLFVQVAKFQELGATKSWNAATKTATFTAGGKTVEVTIGSTTAMVNGVATTMPTAPYIANNLTMVPTRFISEALGWTVSWAAGDIVTITLP